MAPGLHRGTEVLSDDVLHLRNPRASSTDWDHFRHPAYPQSVQQYPFVWRFGYPCCGAPPTEPSTNAMAFVTCLACKDSSWYRRIIGNHPELWRIR